MADLGLANLMRPEGFKCKKKGDNEQMLQDFQQYRRRMELFFTASRVVAAHTGEHADRLTDQQVACASCKQEKALIVMFGEEEPGCSNPQGDSYKAALDKVEAGINKLTN